MLESSIQDAMRIMIDQQLRARGIRNLRVLEAMATVPRHVFVPNVEPTQAYADRALPTIEGQTISQPYIVALMTELLQVEAGLKVLEIGTGSGYQTAILVHLGAVVVTVERSAALAARARATLEALSLSTGVSMVVGDGTRGCLDHAPYDRILVTAGAERLPQAYRGQVVDGGRIVIPVGDRRDQRMVVLDRQGDDWSRYSSIACRFVPLVGEDGWSEER